MTDKTVFFSSEPMILFDQPDPFARLPALAARLGVEPSDGTAGGGFFLATKDGQKFDLFDLVNAVLDRLT